MDFIEQYDGVLMKDFIWYLSVALGVAFFLLVSHYAFAVLIK